MKQPSLKLRINRALENDSSITSIFLMALIVLNVIAVILATVDCIHGQFEKAFFIFEIFSITIFSIEYMMRFSLAGLNNKKHIGPLGKIRFIFTPLPLIDLVAILATMVGTDVRILRVLRIIRLYRYSAGMQALVYVFRVKKSELLSILSLLTIVMVLASSFLYHFENKLQPEAFSSIPATMWWAVATLTTVGYGDITPLTPLGKIFGGITSIIGILMFALPTAIISSGFMEHFRPKRKS